MVKEISILEYNNYQQLARFIEQNRHINTNHDGDIETYIQYKGAIPWLSHNPEITFWICEEVMYVYFDNVDIFKKDIAGWGDEYLNIKYNTICLITKLDFDEYKKTESYT